MTDITRIRAGEPPAPPLVVILRKDKPMLKFIRGAVIALMLAPAAGAAQDFDAGATAFAADDYATALQEWRPLAEQGIPQAQAALGIMYANGNGVTQDHAEAVRWYRLAAEQDVAVAQFDLGRMYATGQGVAKDDAEAVRWFRLAAEQGFAHAQFALGLSYASGIGVVQDYVTAHMWVNIGAANGADKAAKIRGSVEVFLSAADISEAQRRARVCMESGYQECD